MLQEVTRGYKRLQGVQGDSGGYKELERGYRGLQGVTHGVTRGDTWVKLG